MPRYYRNSQKRFYITGAVYFITTRTGNGYPFFQIDSLAELLVRDLELTRHLKNFELLAYKINYDHVHLLIQPQGEHNVSEIMRSLKSNYSRNANRVMAPRRYPDDGLATTTNELQAELRESYSEQILRIRDKFWKERDSQARLPRFEWQRSFRDHIIRNSRDLMNHLRYIENQWIKHGQPTNEYCHISAKARQL